MATSAEPLSQTDYCMCLRTFSKVAFLKNGEFFYSFIFDWIHLMEILLIDPTDQAHVSSSG